MFLFLLFFLQEFKCYYQELIDKGFIRLSNSHWSALMVSFKKNDGPMRKPLIVEI